MSLSGNKVGILGDRRYGNIEIGRLPHVEQTQLWTKQSNE